MNETSSNLSSADPTDHTSGSGPIEAKLANVGFSRMKSGGPRARMVKSLALIAGLALAAAACGADDAADSAAATPTTEAAMADEDAMTEDAMTDEDAMTEDAMAMDEGVSVLSLELDGLNPASAGKDYQVWSVVDGSPVAGGAFDIESGEIVVTSDQAHLYTFDGAESVFITIEDEDRSDAAAPSDTQVLAGDIVGTDVALAGVDGSTASGTGEIR